MTHDVMYVCVAVQVVFNLLACIEFLHHDISAMSALYFHPSSFTSFFMFLLLLTLKSYFKPIQTKGSAPLRSQTLHIPRRARILPKLPPHRPPRSPPYTRIPHRPPLPHRRSQHRQLQPHPLQKIQGMDRILHRQTRRR